MLTELVQKFLNSPHNKRPNPETWRHTDTSISFATQSSTYQISYMTFLANGNQTGHGIYPAIYYYRNYNKVFVVYGQSKKLPKFTWEKFLEKNDPQPLPIRQHFSVQEVLVLEANPYNYLDNYAKAVFDVPEGRVEQADFEAIAFALEEVILEYAAIFKTLAENNGRFPLTDEQQAIVAARGNVVKVNAFAGTGKTSTLVAFAQARPDKRILYLAFNRAICAEATMKFPANVMPRTAHALAFHELKDSYRLHASSYRPTDIAKFIEVDDLNFAQQVNAFLTYFFNSAEPAITDRLFEQFQSQPNREKVLELDAENLVRLSNCLFDKMKNRKVKGTFDFFLKMYQLSNPELPFDVILFDEAQDASPVMLDIVLNQLNAQKVFVGDRHQQIYSFRYAVNALDSLPDAVEFALTTSFRFGPNIAAAASRLIKQYKNEKRSIEGRNEQSEDRIGQVSRNARYAFISRTNGCLFDMAAKTCREEKRLCFVKEFEAIFQDLQNVHNLYRGNRTQIRNPYIASFDNYQALKDFAANTEDKELKSLCNIVERYRNDFQETYTAIRQNAAGNTQETADIILSTAHTSKGLEFKQVMLANDFIDLEKIKPENLSKPEAQEEINILYVAMTRAISVLELPNSTPEAKNPPSLTVPANPQPENVSPADGAVGNLAPLQRLVEQLINSETAEKRKTRYAADAPVINFEVEIVPCPRGIAYLTLLAYGNETGFGIYPAIYYYRAQQKLFVVYGQSKATPPITWEPLLSGLPGPPKSIAENLEYYEVEYIKQQQPRFNYLNNIAAKKFNLQPDGLTNEKACSIAAELAEVISQYGELYSRLPEEDFEAAKVYKTLADGVRVRSKSEVIIANMLYERKITFEYEKPLVDVDGGQYLPDFTVTAGNKTYYWEHLGMLEVEDYRDHWDIKQAWYEKYFSGQLITTEESADLSTHANAIILRILS